VSDAEIIVLGAIAGCTIFFGLPLGRARSLSPMLRAGLNAGAAGVLAFLFVETMEHAFAHVEETVTAHAWGDFAGRAPLFVAAVATGLVGLVYYDRWIARRRQSYGPGAAAIGEMTLGRTASWSEPKRLAFLIALGIGFHNFAEGLAIGQAGASDEIKLAVLLVIGFGLHNATEGFGIVAPLASERELPSWRFLGILGLIGGGPTFVGTVVGQSFVNATLEMTFLALAAGSILYVVVQLLKTAFRLEHHPVHVMWGLFAGLMLGYGTELVLVAAGL
jgi:zinc transporter, ZIP family